MKALHIGFSPALGLAPVRVAEPATALLAAADGFGLFAGATEATGSPFLSSFGG